MFVQLIKAPLPKGGWREATGGYVSLHRVAVPLPLGEGGLSTIIYRSKNYA